MNVSRNRNEILDPTDSKYRLPDLFRSYTVSTGVDYDYHQARSASASQYALVDTREPDQHVREHYLNLGTTYWIEDGFAIGLRGSVFAQQISGEMMTTGSRSMFVTARLVLELICYRHGMPSALDIRPAAGAVGPAESTDQPVAAADRRGVDGHPPRSLARAQPDAARHAGRRRASATSTMLGSDLRRRVVGRVGRSARLRAADGGLLQAVQHREERRRASSIRSASTLEPKLVGSWIGVWGGKVTTGWHFLDPQPWDKVEAMFGTHEAKFQLKKWVEDNQVTHDRSIHAVDRRRARSARSSFACRAITRR